MPFKLKDSLTSAGLKEDQFRFVLESPATAKKTGNVMINTNRLVIATKNITIRSMAHYEHYKCIKLAVV